MRINKRLFLRGYAVEAKDNRTGERFTDTIALDLEAIRTGEMIGMDATALIEAQYNRLGFWVTDVKRIQNVNVNLDLTSLYRPELVGMDGSYNLSNVEITDSK